jgi:hypothetical protein
VGIYSSASQIDLSVPNDARAIDDRCNVAVAVSYGCITWMRGDIPNSEIPSASGATGLTRLLRERALILDGWSRADESGIGLARRGVDNLRSQGVFACMRYWLSLFAGVSARGYRPGAAQAILDAAA